MRCYEFDRKLKSEATGSPGELFPPGFATNAPFIIAGVDEAGRGPLAGPVVAAAVVLPDNPLLYGLRDSKVVPVEQREALYCEILETAVATAVAVVEHDVIDAINIFAASMQAMRLAVRDLGLSPTLVLVDGKQKCGSGYPEKPIVKGDGKSAAVMAASILAKVTRDELMREAHRLYPQYGFDEHKGYACKSHLDAIRKHGPCPIHRRSFEPIRSGVTSFDFFVS